MFVCLNLKTDTSGFIIVSAIEKSAIVLIHTKKTSLLFALFGKKQYILVLERPFCATLSSIISRKVKYTEIIP